MIIFAFFSSNRVCHVCSLFWSFLSDVSEPILSFPVIILNCCFFTLQDLCLYVYMWGVFAFFILGLIRVDSVFPSYNLLLIPGFSDSLGLEFFFFSDWFSQVDGVSSFFFFYSDCWLLLSALMLGPLFLCFTVPLTVAFWLSSILCFPPNTGRCPTLI